MRVRYLNSFDRNFRRLSRQDQLKTTEAVDALLDFFATQKRPQKGLGLKKLRKNFWEIRGSIKVRLLFQLEEDLLTFVLAGSHDDIRHFLGRV